MPHCTMTSAVSFPGIRCPLSDNITVTYRTFIRDYPNPKIRLAYVFSRPDKTCTSVYRESLLISTDCHISDTTGKLATIYFLSHASLLSPARGESGGERGRQLRPLFKGNLLHLNWKYITLFFFFSRGYIFNYSLRFFFSRYLFICPPNWRPRVSHFLDKEEKKDWIPLLFQLK